MSKQRPHLDYYYTMCDEIIALMDDQAGKPFDVINFKRQFRIVAIRHGIPPGSDGYQAHYRIIQGMVARKLPRMQPRQPSLV